MIAGSEEVEGESVERGETEDLRQNEITRIE